MGALLLLVGASVALQLLSAYLVKAGSMRASQGLLFVGALLCAVLLLNAGRFALWNVIHRSYPVSIAYPLSAIFFPAVVALAWASGESVGAMQVVGASIVMAGVVRVVLGGLDAPGAGHVPLSD